jgi:hypothetical protein
VSLAVAGFRQHTAHALQHQAVALGSREIKEIYTSTTKIPAYLRLEITKSKCGEITFAKLYWAYACWGAPAATLD